MQHLKVWNGGVREMLVEDPDGHRIRFGHGIHVSTATQAATIPATIKIIQRIPTASEHLGLIAAVGWSSSLDDAMEEMVFIPHRFFAVVAEDTISGKTIGCALLLGDNASFYYVKDVMVHPEWQQQRIGTALMQAITNWLDEHGAGQKPLWDCNTGDRLRSFYEKFGFSPAFGMNRKVQRR